MHSNKYLLINKQIIFRCFTHAQKTIILKQIKPEGNIGRFLDMEMTKPLCKMTKIFQIYLYIRKYIVYEYRMTKPVWKTTFFYIYGQEQKEDFEINHINQYTQKMIEFKFVQMRNDKDAFPYMKYFKIIFRTEKRRNPVLAQTKRIDFYN